MTSETQQPEGQDGTLSRLNVAIDTLNLAKDVCSIAPAQAAFGAASGLLTMIRVRILRICGDLFLKHVHPGHYGQSTRLRRDRVELRRDLHSARPRNEWEASGRPHSVRVQGDRPVDSVGYTNDTVLVAC